MVWPPPTQKLDWQNADISLDQHPTAHNDIALTLANDYQPQINTNLLNIDTNAAAIAQNAADIVSGDAALQTNIDAVDTAWQQNETARNAWYRVGPNPTLDAGTGTAYVEGAGLRMRDSSANVVPGYVPSVRVQSVSLASATDLGSGWTTISPTITVEADPQLNGFHVFTFTVDVTCDAAGTMVAGLSANNGDPSSAEPQIVWSKTNDGGTIRQLMSQTEVRSFSNSINYRIKAKENSGTFSANSVHTGLTVVSYYGMR